jgi:hypothetical protein
VCHRRPLSLTECREATTSWADRQDAIARAQAIKGDPVVVRDRTPVCRAAKTARELLDQYPW